MNDNPLKQITGIKDDLRRILEQIPDIAGMKAVKFFSINYTKEGWVENAKLNKWQLRKPVMRGVKVIENNNPILVKTGRLWRSIRYKKEGDNAVRIGSDVEYAAAHNEGTTTAGRGNSTTIPQRQFIGPSPDVIKSAERDVWKMIENAIKKANG